MNTEKTEKECGCSEFLGNAGTALIILAFFIGIGGCEYLEYSGMAKRTEAEAKAKVLEHSIKQ